MGKHSCDDANAALVAAATALNALQARVKELEAALAAATAREAVLVGHLRRMMDAYRRAGGSPASSFYEEALALASPSDAAKALLDRLAAFEAGVGMAETLTRMQARHQAALEDLRRRCAEAGSGAVRHYQQTTDQCRAEVREAVLAVPLEEG